MVMSAHTIRPIPNVNEVTKPFWDGTKQHKLLGQQCRKCRAYVWTPKLACPQCLSEDLRWSECSGRGTVYSFTVINRSPTPGYEVPYTVVLVELDECWRVVSNFVG